MSLFDLHQYALSDYRDFVRSFLVIADERALEFVENALVLHSKSVISTFPPFLRTSALC